MSSETNVIVVDNDTSKQFRVGFTSSGVKSHELIEGTHELVLVTDKPSEHTYTLSYFDLANIWSIYFRNKKSTYDKIVSALTNYKSVYVDYDNIEAYVKSKESYKQGFLICEDLGQVMSGNINEEDYERVYEI